MPCFTCIDNGKKYHDKRAHKLPQLNLGDRVSLQDPRDNAWSKEGVITEKLQHPRNITETLLYPTL